jgi:uncharacterized protein
MLIDLFEFARQHGTASGVTSLAQLERIEAADRSNDLAWRAAGSNHGRHGALRLDLTIDGEVQLICQRCLQPMTVPLHLRSKFLIAASEDAADALDQDDDFDVVVGSAQFELDTLIEDEVILALPIAPRHAVCPDGRTDASDGVSKPSPFAALAALKTGTKQGDDRGH